MTAATLAQLRAQIREIDRDLLRALAARARFPRHPRPLWPGTETRLPLPPLAEILYALAPAGTTDSTPDAENRGLVAALLARQRLGQQIADAKAGDRPGDYRAALDAGDRDRLLALLTDLPAELRLLEFIRAAAAELAPNLPPGLAPLLWREYIIPWTRQSEAAHLLEP
jgi:chorismate mutase